MIAVGEVLRRVTSRICCFAVRSRLAVLCYSSRTSIWEEVNSFPCRCPTRGPFEADFVFLMRIDFFDQIPGILFFLWYLDDSTIVGTQPTVLEFLHQVESLSLSFGFFLNKKCEFYWPTGNQLFMNFPSEIHRPFNGLELLRL